MSRTILRGAGLACLLLIGMSVGAVAQANFAGTWSLDKSKSKELPTQMADNIESYTVVVTQDEKQLTAETKIARKEGAEGGGPSGGGSAAGGPGGAPGTGGPGSGQGGGRGRGGFGMGLPTATYKLDGSETKVESGGGRPGSATLKAEWKDAGKSLELTNVRKFSTPDGEMTSTTKENWSLSEDGKVLTIQRSSESRRGPLKYTLVLNKQ